MKGGNTVALRLGELSRDWAAQTVEASIRKKLSYLGPECLKGSGVSDDGIVFVQSAEAEDYGFDVWVWRGARGEQIFKKTELTVFVSMESYQGMFERGPVGVPQEEKISRGRKGARERDRAPPTLRGGRTSGSRFTEQVELHMGLWR